MPSIIAFYALFSLRIYLSQTESRVFKQEQTILSTETGIILSIAPHIDGSIVTIFFVLVIMHFKCMPTDICKTCSDRNTKMTIELLPKMVQLLDLLSVHSHSLVNLPNLLFETILLHLDPFLRTVHASFEVVVHFIISAST